MFPSARYNYITHENIIATPVAPVYKLNSFASEMVSQALIWDEIDILDQKDDWNYVRLDDQYKGWIHNFYITSTNKFRTSYSKISGDFMRITKRFQSVNDNNGNIILILSFGSRIPSLSFKENDLENKHSKIEVLLTDGSTGFIEKQPTVPNILKQKDLSFESIVKISKKLINVPYLWGGKSSFGYDCSGFVQSVYKLHDVTLKRDSIDMYNDLKDKKVGMEDIKLGHLIFFVKNNIDHVGIVISQTEFIHCSGFVRINSFVNDETDYYKKINDYKLIFISPV